MDSELIQSLVYDVETPQGFVFIVGDLNYRINMDAQSVKYVQLYSVVFATDCGRSGSEGS